MATKKITQQVESTEVEQPTEVEQLQVESINVKNVPTMAQIAKEVEKAARKLRRVTVHYNDPRDSHLVTSAYANCDNAYFSIGKIIPLDTSIELEQALCDNLAEAKVQVHIPDPKGSGNMTVKMIAKYSVIYED